MKTVFTEFINRVCMVSNYYFPDYRKPSYPQEIVIELTNHCNLACKMCPHKTMKRKKGFMDETLFKKIIDEIRTKTELVYLYGTGESLLHKRLPKFAMYAKKNGLSTCLSTNGLLMNGIVAERLLTCGIDYLIIALDGGIKKTYEEIRINGNFDVLIANIKQLLFLQSQLKTPTKICLQMIYMPENSNEIELFKNLFTAEEKKCIHQFRFKPLYETYALRQQDVHHTKPCYWLWNMMSIHWNGDVALCCMDSDSAYKFGNIGKKSVLNIWQSQNFNQIRDKHKKLEYSDQSICKTCDIPEQGYFNHVTILGSLFVSAAKVREILPIYEKLVLLPMGNLK